MTTRHIGSGRPIESGVLAVRKDDFNTHVAGGDFKHTADSVIVTPTITGVAGSDVQTVLENLKSLILVSGVGFISIGITDGYATDGYVEGNYNVGTAETPTLASAFAAAIANPRLTNGGIIFMLAGTYHLSSTISVPPGISIMGEIGGTLIIGEMPETPMFEIDYNRQVYRVGGDSGSGPINMTTGSSVEEVRFFNLMLADNIQGSVLFGEPTMTTVPMVRCKNGSNVVFEHVSFIGRIHSGTVTGRLKTKAAIGYTSGGGLGSILTMDDCFFDAMRVGIEFTPGSNESDFLTVSNCKARIYGTEDSSDKSPNKNCFINMSMCHANIVDNYHIGAGLQANYFLVISSGVGTNVKIVAQGNSGSPNIAADGILIVNSSGSTFTSVVSNNNWGYFINSTWSIVVGSGAATIGDINGIGAIDIILAMANSITNFNATVIVNTGTYIITGAPLLINNFANLKFIGNKHGKEYPIFSLDLTSTSTDALSNRPLTLGNHLESIQFVSENHRHSIRPTFNATSQSNATQTGGGTIEIKDCMFVNTTLFAQDLPTFPVKVYHGEVISAKIEVTDCHFLQDTFFADTFSMVLPRVDSIHVDNCYFNGAGYAFCIGSNGYSGGQSGNSTVTITNTTCDMVDHTTAENYTITMANGLGVNSYINISGVYNVNMDNVQVYVGDALSAGSPNDTIDTSLTLGATVSKFINISAEIVNIANSVFTGPIQTVRISSTDYAMPTLYVQAMASGKIYNCKFWVSALPLQIGPSTLSDATFSDQFVIDNCGFQSGGRVAIDFDMWIASQDVQPQIIVSNCNIQAGGTSWPVYHSVFTAPCLAAIQILAGDADVQFINNIITANLSTVTATTPTKYSGVYIDAITNSGTTGDQANSINFSGNSIYITNTYAVTDAAVSVSCAYLLGSVLKVNNNTLSMSNSNFTGTNFTGCLVIDNQPVFASTYSTGIVSNNIFAKTDIFGTATTLMRGYILITSSTTKTGMIVDNFFDSSTINGSATTLIEDNAGTAWVALRNKNQTVAQTCVWSVGSKGISTGADTSTAVMYGGAVSSSLIRAVPATANQIVFRYLNTTNADEFRWSIPLQHILPPQVNIVSVVFKYQSTVAAPTAGTVYGSLYGLAGVSTNSVSIADTSQHTQVITLGFTYTTKPTDLLYLIIGANLTHSAAMTVTITDVVITYRY